MGKTKIKIIDDSAGVEESKKPAKKLDRPASPAKRGESTPTSQRRGERDELVEKLKAELGIPEETTANTPEVKPEVKLKQDTSEVSKAERRTHLRGEESAEPQAKHLGGGVKPAKAKPRSKKYLEALKNLDRSKFYPLPEALDMVKKMSYAKFNATLEAHINTLQTGLRGLLQLPYAKVKKLRILAFGKGAEESGASFFGDDSTLEAIAKGQTNFDLIITTPEWMPKLAKVAKVLGPKGLMPNPKNGTITEDLKKTIESFQGGKTEYKTESKAPVIHMSLGKLSQPNEELEANIKILLSTLGKTKIKKVTLSPTMGPGVKIDLASI